MRKLTGEEELLLTLKLGRVSYTMQFLTDQSRTEEFYNRFGYFHAYTDEDGFRHEYWAACSPGDANEQTHNTLKCDLYDYYFGSGYPDAETLLRRHTATFKSPWKD